MKFGLIGYPVAQSKSPSIFADLFKKHKLEGTYDLIPLKNLEEFEMFMQNGIFAFNGINVTIPYKKEVLPWLTSLDETAAKSQSVNAILIQKKELIGFNTDIFGFEQTLLPLINKQQKALIFGNGGSALAVSYVFKKLNISFTIVSRKKETNTLIYKDLNQSHFQQHTLLVNTTPLGMWPNLEDFIDIPYEYVNHKHTVIDLIYNPTETIFLALCKQAGAKTVNGNKMLLEQAYKAFKIFTNEKK